MFVPYAISWNLTSRCNLNCGHCYIDAGGRMDGGPAELTTAECLDIVSQIADVNSGAVLILTGGEPLARKDIYEIARHGSSLGLMVVVGTNGTLVNGDTVAKLKDAGVTGIGVSIDSLDSQKHDTFRGMPGALAKSMEGISIAREAGLGVQIQTTPMKNNLVEIPLIAEWAHRMGARVFNLFFLVCTGRGEEMADISPDEYERVLKWAAKERDSFPGMMIRPKCAPHFKRILHQENPDNHLLKTYIAACRAGTHYARITPEGKMTPCPYMDNVAGDLKTEKFSEVWENSETLTRYRTPEYGGKCGLCQYRLLCGGCRARALATVGDDMGEDQWCVYEPLGQEEAIVNIDTQAKFGVEETSSVKWSEDALAVMEKIPFFARKIVKLGVEKRALEEGVELITSEVIRSAAPSPVMFDQMKKVGKDAGAPDATKILWDDEALARVENAPDFVRPGIKKLMPKRARERGKDRITTEFLTEIRDESMMLATRRMKSLGFSELKMDAWGEAKEKFKKSPDKQRVIDKISGFLGDRPAKNKKIIEKFGSFFSDDTGEKLGWTEDARARLDKAPSFARPMAKKAIEGYARKNGFKYVTEEAVEGAMADMPFGKIGK